MINWFKRKSPETANDPKSVTVIPRDQHNISRQNISEAAVKVLYRLHKAGYQALLVGGGVRDTLLGLHPKDFDVATNATPEQIHQLFKNSRLIGRRFKLVHVIFGREVIEVATFRSAPSEEHGKHESATGAQGMILRDNVYGTQDDDAIRRDFTINALYYNIADFSVHAYAGGWEDLQSRTLRMIGDPTTRYREDPVRMLRAVRFAAKLDFKLEKSTQAPISELAPLLENIAPARQFDEVLKLFLHGRAVDTFKRVQDFKLFAHLMPEVDYIIEQDANAKTFVMNALYNTDQRIQMGKSVTPYYFFAALLWPVVRRIQVQLEHNGEPEFGALRAASEQAIAQQVRFTAIPKRFSIPMREIWEMQLRMTRTNSKKVPDMYAHPRFRAAYDFILLREQSGEKLNGLGDFWTQYQDTHPAPERVEKRYDKPKRNRRRTRKPASKR